MIINGSDFCKTGGLTEQELQVYDLLDYRLLKLPKFKKYEVEISNAIHIVQAIFMQRTMVRLTEGKFWVKYNLPPENNFPLKKFIIPKEYQDIKKSYLNFLEEFKKLELYHPYHHDDVRRAINSIFEIINLVGGNDERNM